MNIQKKPTLAEKQAFWAEQLPNFEATYWLPSHFEFLAFDMDQGNYVINDDLSPDFECDATEIWHRVNTGWAMWKKAINFSRKQAQAVPEWVSVKDELPSEGDLLLGISTTKLAKFNVYQVVALDEFDDCEITHWMHLPQAPKDQEQSHD